MFLALYIIIIIIVIIIIINLFNVLGLYGSCDKRGCTISLCTRKVKHPQFL
jgi:ABC-type cobalt transport system substrate-binding protein